MPHEHDGDVVSKHEHAERRHSADKGNVTPAIHGDERIEREDETEQDRIARAAGATGPDTVTDPLELMSQDDRPGQSDRGRRA